MPSLFNSESYHALKLEARERYVCYERDGASIAGILDQERWFTSGERAPFGGFDFTRQRDPDAFAKVLALTEMIPERSTIRCKPASYSANEVVAQHALVQAGFWLSRSELSYSFDVTQWPTHEAYVASLKTEARRALRHLDGEPWWYGRSYDVPSTYDLIAKNRAAKGRPLGLSLDYIGRLSAAHPGQVRWFDLRHDGDLVAAALLYRVQPGVELVEYWGDHHNLPRSPMNLLASKVIETAIAEGVRVVDLGLSSVDGVPDLGLIQFKQSVGARAELRLDFARG